MMCPSRREVTATAVVETSSHVCLSNMRDVMRRVQQPHVQLQVPGLTLLQLCSVQEVTVSRTFSMLCSQQQR